VVNPFLIRFSAYFSDRIFAIIENFDPRFDVYPFFFPLLDTFDDVDRLAHPLFFVHPIT
jgi:hypothetical protein